MRVCYRVIPMRIYVIEVVSHKGYSTVCDVVNYLTLSLCSPFSLSTSHPGSVASTPALPTDTGGFLRPGTATNLPATVCQESDGN